MKKRKIAGFLALSCLCSAMLGTGCTSQNNVVTKPDINQIVIPNGQNGGKGNNESRKGNFPIEYGKKAPERMKMSDGTEAKETVSRQEADQIRNFAIESSGKIFPNTEGNYLYSPASLYMALQLCGSLTADGSAADLMEFLGAKDREELLSQGNTLIRALSSEEEGSVLRIGNSAWLDQNRIPEIGQEGYDALEKSAAALGTDIYREVLLEKATQDKIDAWISDRTNGLIKELPVDPDEETAMILLNTLYFDKHWAREVGENDVNRTLFYPAGTDTAVEIDRIDYTMESHPFVKTEHAVASAAKYRDGSYIIFLKPASGEKLDTVMTEDLSEVIKAYANHSFTELDTPWEVKFGIPLLDYETKMEDLEETVREMGVSSVFAAGAFSEISPSMYVSAIAQDCHIIMDREGTKAAAVTEIMTRALAIAPQETEVIDLRLNHEYGYVIMSEDDVPLFIGAVRDAWSE